MESIISRHAVGEGRREHDTFKQWKHWTGNQQFDFHQATYSCCDTLTSSVNAGDNTYLPHRNSEGLWFTNYCQSLIEYSDNHADIESLHSKGAGHAKFHGIISLALWFQQRHYVGALAGGVGLQDLCYAEGEGEKMHSRAFSLPVVEDTPTKSISGKLTLPLWENWGSTDATCLDNHKYRSYIKSFPLLPLCWQMTSCKNLNMILHLQDNAF